MPPCRLSRAHTPTQGLRTLHLSEIVFIHLNIFCISCRTTENLCILQDNIRQNCAQFKIWDKTSLHCGIHKKNCQHNYTLKIKQETHGPHYSHELQSQTKASWEKVSLNHPHGSEKMFQRWASYENSTNFKIIFIWERYMQSRFKQTLNTLTKESLCHMWLKFTQWFYRK